MKMKGLRAVAIVTAGATAILATSCAPSKDEADSGSGSSDVLTIGTTTDVVSFNPLVGNSRTDYWVTNLMYPHLLTIDKAGEKKENLAVDWGYKNPTTGYYKIRDDFEWSDGKALTAKDVAFTLNAVKQDKPAGTLYGQLANFTSAEAVSDTTVLVHLARPDATVITEIGFWGNIVPKHVFGKAKSVATFANDKSWVGAGPYTLTNVSKGQSYTLKRHEPYPLAPHGDPTLSEVVYRVYPDVNSEILALKNGDIDVIGNTLPPSQVDPLQQADGITLSKIPGLGYEHLLYNMKRPPLDDVRVRQALAHAVDYKAIREVVLQGQAASTGSSPISPVLKKWFDPDLEQYAFDPKLSRSLLRKAGYSEGKDGDFPLKFTLIYSQQDPVTAQLSELVKEGAAKAGITIDLRGLERNTYLAKTDSGDYDIYAGNFAIMDDPTTNMALTYLPGGAINYTHVSDPRLSKVIRQATTTIDVDKRKALVQEAAKIVHDRVYDNILYARDFYVAHGSDWTGFTVKPSELLSIVGPRSLANAERSG